jgi:hypothetical protein
VCVVLARCVQAQDFTPHTQQLAAWIGAASYSNKDEDLTGRGCHVSPPPAGDRLASAPAAGRHPES